MTKNQIDQYNMLLTTENHLDDNPTLWAGNAPITATKTLFTNKLDVLAGQIALQLVNPTGITDEKNNVKTDLINKAFVIAAACCSYAAATSKPELFSKCNLTKSDFIHYKEAELIGVCTNIFTDANANVAALAPYGVTAAILTSFQTNITAFSGVTRNPVTAIAKRTTATAEIARLLPEIIQLVETRLDKDMVALSLTQPAFYDTYSNVRYLNLSPTTTMSLTTTVLEKDTNVPIANVNIEIVGEGITRVSSDRGYNTVLNLVSGPHTISATHPNYVTQNVPFTIVSGETTELVIILERV